MSAVKIGMITDELVTMFEETSASAIYDGPIVTSEYVEDFIVVGGTEDPDDDEASTFTQDWNGLGAKTKTEAGEIINAVLVGTGNQTVKTARDKALVLLAEVEALVRADPSLGGILVGGWCQMNSGRMTQRQTSQGLYVRVVFTIAYQTKN